MIYLCSAKTVQAFHICCFTQPAGRLWAVKTGLAIFPNREFSSNYSLEEPHLQQLPAGGGEAWPPLVLFSTEQAQNEAPLHRYCSNTRQYFFSCVQFSFMIFEGNEEEGVTAQLILFILRYWINSRRAIILTDNNAASKFYFLWGACWDKSLLGCSG